MDRRSALPLAAMVAMLIGAIVVYLLKTSGQNAAEVRTVVVGSASPISVAAPARVQIGPHVDESSGILTIGVGDSVDSNGVLFGVTGVQAPYTGPGTPSASATGAPELIVINVEIHNSLSPGGDVVTIASASNFELQDESGRVYDQTSAEDAPKPPDGKIGPGQTLDGSLAYRAPAGQSYRLVFKEELVSQGRIAVDLGRI